MKKTIITLSAFFISLVTLAQNYGNQASNFDQNNSGWEIGASFGSINFDNTDTVDTRDNINVGVTVDVTKVFKNNIYIQAGTHFSTFKDVGLWENPVEYLSGNLSVGYRIQTSGLTQIYIAGGSSYIKALNTIPNAEASFSGNITGGFIWWLRDSNFGLTAEDTYKFVDSDSNVSHNQIMVGIRYKL